MADVFLSYKREDRPLCVAVHDALAALRLAVWFDARLELGVRFDKEIEREIHEAAAVLVLWSPQSAASDWVREEALVGRDRDCLVSARIAPCQLPMGFKAVQTADIFEGALDGANEAWLQMLERIGRIVGRPGLADFVRCERAAATDSWQAWLVSHRDDPLMPRAVELLAASAGPDLRKRLAEENARRIMLEGQVEEYRATQEGHTSQLRQTGAELEKMRRERPPPAPPPPAAPDWERQAQAEAARIAAAQAAPPAPRRPRPPAPAPRSWSHGNGPWLLLIGASLLVAATALVLILLRRGADESERDVAAARVPPFNQAAPAVAAPAAPVPARPEPETGRRDYQPIPSPAEEEARAPPAPPLFPDSAWSYVATDTSGNVYAVRSSDQSEGSEMRRLWVRGDHSADQSIMHRYSMTLWAFNCVDQTFALTGRTNYHADGRVDRRPLPDPRVSRPVIAALGAVACR
ncbi:MAG TPA: toll/interleukin-1 receptor domain-containing protein [Allosphingosinicella sp.]|nr:toll/interleukin-1 receptor domain-containing protein [Allosphingosinicella sp.]